MKIKGRPHCSMKRRHLQWSTLSLLHGAESLTMELRRNAPFVEMVLPRQMSPYRLIDESVARSPAELLQKTIVTDKYSTIATVCSSTYMTWCPGDWCEKHVSVFLLELDYEYVCCKLRYHLSWGHTQCNYDFVDKTAVRLHGVLNLN